ncbi:PTS sugar transporter subunit IIB [Photobacterium angustum]|uniref:PTS sugar transporter subunit IIB n=2 Tax=Photobacterium angustum TaxID=661 RepID=A0A855S8E2_PHOAN|nr:PTS sugar transporter subunit IIB [Photobacterium angustum]KJF81600.1 cytochrome C biogenesis protein CcmE [Photobacterium damselae subsp. damselae]EAS63518.1 putative PTS system, cellobiose-specific IIBcomponent [Vibrio angustum S14] [Photobacterium angustum S14]KJG30931.1 cytochrome C biogenesis protein CcmE [Photobacterium angustum]KJG40852.1 cytochrome C biogenesis protein CcmE [Photobacterium angustum]KJG45246.1 cytochrome C biogenesis protein CcmE [Photobacterium angustum]
MIKIFLCCAAGMSTSMVVNKMRKAAEESNIDAEINAYSISAFETEVKRNDVCLVAPQVKYKFSEFSKRCKEENVGCGQIDMMQYGMMKGKEILEQAIKLKA